MATRTQVILEDDIDGSEADESITFSLDGVTYEIDLNEKNAEALRESFRQWVEAGRRTGGRQRQGTGTRSIIRTTLPAQSAPLTMGDRHAIQRWAVANGYEPPAERGRIGAEIRNAWKDAGSPA